jgi:predicted TIM-barrel enzyme
MSLYRTTFPKKHTFIAVVHVEDETTMLRNVAVAQKQGADGVFLISHARVQWPQLLSLYHAARARFPSYWMGVNMLDLRAREAVALHRYTGDGVWADDAGVYSNADTTEARRVARSRASGGWKGIYFGGVAFKHQRQVADFAEAACAAIPYVDVVTTSGSATGTAPDPHKIQCMKEAIGRHPLAIASGMTPDNVATFMPWADCFLVATGISSSFTELNPRLVRAFSEAVR